MPSAAKEAAEPRALLPSILDKAFKGGLQNGCENRTLWSLMSTVLILGAGASKPYGFPLEQELKIKSFELPIGSTISRAIH